MIPPELLGKKFESKRMPDVRTQLPSHQVGNAPARPFLSEDAFASMLYLERRRAERAHKRFVLVLLDLKTCLRGRQKERDISALAATLSEATRETDVMGWYFQDNLLGVIGTELGQASSSEAGESILKKFRLALREALGSEKASSVFISLHFFPEDAENGDGRGSAFRALYRDLARTAPPRRFALGLKRFMDIIGSACALISLSPLFLAIAAAIKVGSKGPVLFRQERLGQHGKKFSLLKFRSMYTECDSKIHEEYVSRFIAGKVSETEEECEKRVFKLQDDPRITPIGAFLRKTSLDELPQFLNVLAGEMSLVGPRPPLEYEFKAYETWHRRRVLEIKPGITGLWQVYGRSKTTFNDMVRLDLHYSKNWSLLMDLKILFDTPGAVFSGDGAH